MLHTPLGGNNLPTKKTHHPEDIDATYISIYLPTNKRINQGSNFGRILIWVNDGQVITEISPNRKNNTNSHRNIIKSPRFITKHRSHPALNTSIAQIVILNGFLFSPQLWVSTELKVRASPPFVKLENNTGLIVQR